MKHPTQTVKLPILSDTENLSGHVGEDRKHEGIPKPVRIRPRVENFSNENPASLGKIPALKYRHKASSIQSNTSFSGRGVLRPIGINISNSSRPSPSNKDSSRRLRSGSEGKIQSLRPVEDDFDSPQQRPKDDTHPFISWETQSAEPNFALPDGNRLSCKNLETLAHLSQRHTHPDQHVGPDPQPNGVAESKKKSDLVNEGASETDCSLIPTLGSSSRSCSFSDEKLSDNTSQADYSQTLRSSFFYPGTILPAPHTCEMDRFDRHKNNEDLSNSLQSTPYREALLRLETMIVKQRRVDFEPMETSATNHERTSNEYETHLDEHPRSYLLSTCSVMGKVRCALSESERLLGVRWIHNVDTTLTTNPHVTPEIRYHASLLFSLYWGSRSSKVAKPETTTGSQQRITRDLQGEREAKKKMKLIAATAMACLTLTIKWYFDFCKPLFTLQLLSFCKTTDFRTFRVTPEDLIVAERAILFSYPIAGGLWLDSPHAFLEELIHIVPALKLLSNTPRYRFSPKGSKCLKNVECGIAEPTNSPTSRNILRWDWPEVVRKFERTLAKATIKQEFLAFEPSVFCVVALYISLDAVEPGYYEEGSETTIVSHPDRLNRESEQAGVGFWATESKFIEKEREQVKVPSQHVNERGITWRWRWIDINDTMDQVCRVVQVSKEDVEACLDWFCQLECF